MKLIMLNTGPKNFGTPGVSVRVLWSIGQSFDNIDIDKTKCTNKWPI